MVQPVHDRPEALRDELYEQYRSVPAHQHAEIVRGTLYVMSRPGPRHTRTASKLGAELDGPFDRGRGGPGGWWILDEPELQLVAKEPVVPDLEDQVRRGDGGARAQGDGDRAHRARRSGQSDVVSYSGRTFIAAFAAANAWLSLHLSNTGA
jgi:hypothetical protein